MERARSFAPVVDELLRLSTDRRSGRLRVRTAEGDRAVFLIRGVPSLVTSSVAGERIGELLSQRGHVREEEIETLVAAARSSNQRLDSHLVAIGRLDAPALKRIVSESSLIFLARLWEAQEADLLFTALDRPVEDGMKLHRPQAVLNALVVKRIHDDVVLRRILGGEEKRLRLTGEPYRLLAALPLEEGDDSLLDPEPKLAGRLIRVHPKGETFGLRAAAWMVASGLLEAGEGAAPGRPELAEWNRVMAEEPKASDDAGFRPQEIAGREEVLEELDRAGRGRIDDPWESGLRIHPDRAFAPALADLSSRLHFAFPALFEGGQPRGESPPDENERQRRILNRKLAASHLDFASALVEGGESRRALALLLRCAELDSGRTDLPARIRQVLASRPDLTLEAESALGAKSLEGAREAGLRELLAEIRSGAIEGKTV